MSDLMNVLVLGVGGNVSQGILKAIALCGLRCRVVGACVHPRSFGLFTVDRAYISPPAADPTFLDWLVDTCRMERIHAVLSGVEPVVEALAHHAQAIRSKTGAICIVSPPESLKIADDKLLTCEWLQQNGLAFPRYADSENTVAVRELGMACGYPLVAKPRHGKGAEGIFIVRNENELQLIRCLRRGYVIQEYLGTPDQEYTAACFSDRDGQLRGTLVLRRDLLEGTTYRAEAGVFPLVREEAIRIAAALRPTGPCNLQMRIHRGVATCFEINLRFSGTTALRARLGFNDVEAALRHYVLGEPAAELPMITHGIALRYWNEAYVDERAIAELENTSQLKPNEYPIVIEDYGIRT